MKRWLAFMFCIFAHRKYQFVDTVEDVLITRCRKCEGVDK